MDKSQTSKVEELSYEAALDELTKLVASLESEEHTLDEAIQIFERGKLLAQHCSKLLVNAELKIKEINGDQIVESAQEQ